MKSRKLVLVLLAMVVLSILGTIVLAQEGQSQPTEPIIYEDLAFPELPYPSRWVEVNGSKMHYLETGDPGSDPILFIHGNPTWSYLWRNVLPYAEPYGRVIAVDLIGMGRSDKPDIGYYYRDHIGYLEGFIEALQLENITFVIHDWGSALGFDYAARHEDNVKAIAFMEAIIPPAAPIESYEAMGPFADLFRAFRTPGVGEEMIMNQNFFIEELLPMLVVRELTQEEMDAYRAPFPAPEDRYPVWRWPNEVPIAGEPRDTTALTLNYGEWLTRTEVPMLHVYVTPGAVNPEVSVEWSRENIKNIEMAFVGEGLHFIQEDHPDEIGQAIADWLEHTVNANS